MHQGVHALGDVVFELPRVLGRPSRDHALGEADLFLELLFPDPIGGVVELLRHGALSLARVTRHLVQLALKLSHTLRQLVLPLQQAGHVLRLVLADAFQPLDVGLDFPLLFGQLLSLALGVAGVAREAVGPVLLEETPRLLQPVQCGRSFTSAAILPGRGTPPHGFGRLLKAASGFLHIGKGVLAR